MTIIRIQVRLPGDEEEGDHGKGDPMETEAKAAGQTSTSRSKGKRSRALTSSVVPPDAFREVQNEHTDRMTAIQDQLNILSTKFDSINCSQLTR